MSHLYSKQINPTVDVGECNELAGIIEVRDNGVLIFCKLGHLIKGRIFPSAKESKSFAEKLSAKLKVDTLETYTTA